MNKSVAKKYNELFPATEIRPGVHFPDWTTVSSDTAADALAAILTAFGTNDDSKSALSPDETRVRQAVLHLFARYGRAPVLSEIAECADLEADQVRALLNLLNSPDLVVLNDDVEVTGSYPLTIHQTDHRVSVGPQSINAMCAIDALGVGAMYDRDVHIQSSCRNRGADVHIDTADKGRALKPACARCLHSFAVINVSKAGAWKIIRTRLDMGSRRTKALALAGLFSDKHYFRAK
jgi:mercuric reductase